MKKIRLTRTTVIEYKPVKENYPKQCDSIEKMAESDINSNCVAELFDFAIDSGSDDLIKDEVKYEIIND